jgi:hypothetical protein
MKERRHFLLFEKDLTRQGKNEVAKKALDASTSETAPKSIKLPPGLRGGNR